MRIIRNISLVIPFQPINTIPILDVCKASDVGYFVSSLSGRLSLFSQQMFLEWAFPKENTKKLVFKRG